MQHSSFYFLGEVKWLLSRGSQKKGSIVKELLTSVNFMLIKRGFKKIGAKITLCKSEIKLYRVQPL